MNYLIGNYLKVSYRTLIKNKLFSFLNIFGLAVGIASCLLLAQYVFFEYSYDRFHENAEDIYRVSGSRIKEESGSAKNHPTVGPTMKMDFPEVRDFCRFVKPSIIFRTKNLAIKYTDEFGNIKSFRKDQMLIVKSPAIYDSTTWNGINYFKSELQHFSQIISVTYSSEIPGHQIESHNEFRRIHQPLEVRVHNRLHAVDNNFFETFNVPLLAGRYFSLNDSTWIWNSENNRIILNRKAAEMVGFNELEEAIGQQVYFRLGNKWHIAEIIGVVENYHQRSLREEFDPILYYYSTYENYAYYSIHITTQNLSETLRVVRNLYQEALPANPFDYLFLDEYFDWQYRGEQQFGKIVGVFGFLAILIACLGLYGLSLFMVNQRKKEIGIRKVFGSSIFQILKLLFKDFFILSLISLMIAGPFIYWFGQRWLNNFSYRIEINWSIFVVPIMTLILISLITTGIQTLKAAMESPVVALKHE